MSITSAEFLLFVAVTASLYYSIPRYYRWIVLLLSSIYYIIIENGIKLTTIILIMTIVTWLAGIFLDKKKKKGILIVALLINVGFLITLKEINFFLGTIRVVGNFLGHPLKISNLYLLAPLGISYYTLSMISYLLDLYWGVGQVQKNYAKFLLFAGYFPILSSGPILRYREIEKQLYEGHHLDDRKISFGIQRILWGLFKKLVIAERLAVIVNTIYGNYQTYTGFYIWIAIICFVFQLYSDFSGCIDIVLGVSEIFGIFLPENFNTPFFSKSLSEFWRRWHITLGAWLRDYILYPILKTSLWQKIGSNTKRKFGKRLGKKIPVWLAMLISWFLIGFWHGGAWNYIIGVGLWFWFLIVFGEVCEPLFQWFIKRLKINTDCFSYKLFQSLRTFFLFAVGLSFFRSYGGFMEGIKLWKAGFSIFNPWILFDGSIMQLGLNKWEMLILIISLTILGISGIIKENLKFSVREWLIKQNLIFRWILLYGLIFGILFLGYYGTGYDASVFIYQGF